MLEILIFLAKQPILFFIGISFPLYIVYKRYLQNGKTSLQFAAIVAGIIVIYYFGIAIGYVFCPSFLDHIEPTILNHSLLISDGHPIYTSVHSANRISLIYGPSTYFINTLLLDILPAHPLFSSKLSGFLLSMTSILMISYISFKKYSWQYAIMALTIYTAALLPFAHFSFWNRPDSLILVAVSMGVFAANIKLKYFSVLILSLSSVLAVNAKLHSVLYFIPILYLYLNSKGLKNLIISIIISIPLFFVPFLHPSFPLTNYLYWVFQATTHEIVTHS